LSAPYFLVIGSGFKSGPESGKPLIVPGMANPWLAGMPNGFREANGDVAPDESPVFFTNFTAGARLQFAEIRLSRPQIERSVDERPTSHGRNRNQGRRAQEQSKSKRKSKMKSLNWSTAISG
jgi:hypothetical protein